MTTVYFVRHAESDRLVRDGRVRPLTEKGLIDRRLVTDFLSDKKIDIVLSSPFKRAIDTVADFSEKYEFEIELVEDFREQQSGRDLPRDIAGNPSDTFLRCQWENFNFRFSDGETLAELCRRNIAALKGALEQHKDRNIAIGTHATALSTIINYYDAAYGFEDFLAMIPKMPWVVRMEFDGEVFIKMEKIDLFDDLRVEAKKYDMFLFDADDTLYDYDKAEAHALKTMFDYCGFTYEESIRTIYREINSQAWRDYEAGKISMTDLQTIRFERLFKEIGVSHDTRDFNTRYLAELGRGTFLIDGAPEICKAIVSKNKQIFIVTNGMLATQESRIKHSLIKEYISDYFVSGFVGYQKPDVRYFEYVFAHIPKVSKEKIMIIGDSLSADIAGGNNAGIDSCWFNPHGYSNDTGIEPTYEVSKLTDLVKFV